MKRLIALTILVAAIGATGIASAATAKKTSGTAWVGVTHTEGQTLFVAGDLKDKLLGRGTIVYVTKVRAGQQPGTFHITATRVTISTTKGSLIGTGKGTQVVAQDGSVNVTDGSFSLTKGTGAYKGHTLKGTFSGPFKNSVYTFKYKATYR
jgi:hypothetical protein